MPSHDQPPQPEPGLAQILERNAELVAAALRHAPGASPPLTALLAARTTADAVEQATRMFVRRARSAGATWQEIGELLTISRQAAQQRFAEVAPDAEQVALKDRAVELIGEIDAGRWDRATADWDEPMQAKLGPERLAEAWRTVTASAGELQTIGQAALVRRGPYRIADVPLLFAHGPMKARVVFAHDGRVSGFFVLLPDAP
jgi:hypothetical protein